MKTRHTNPQACVEHAGSPLVIAASGRIEVRASREFHSGESLDDHHCGPAMRAMPVGRSFRGSGAWRAIARQQLLAEWKTVRAESIRKETKIPDSHEAFWQHVQEEAAQELCSHQRHAALLAAAGIVFPAKGDALAIKC